MPELTERNYPAGRMTARDFQRVLSGTDPENPQATIGEGGRLSVTTERTSGRNLDVISGGPDRTQQISTSATSERYQYDPETQFLQATDEYLAELKELYDIVSPMAYDAYGGSSYARQATLLPSSVVNGAAKAVVNQGVALYRLPQTFRAAGMESGWEDIRNKADEKDVKEAELFLRNFADPSAFANSDIEHYSQYHNIKLSDNAKNLLYTFQDYMQIRKDEEMWAQASDLYNSAGWGITEKLPGIVNWAIVDPAKINRGNANSLMLKVGELAGNVYASRLTFKTAALATRGTMLKLASKLPYKLGIKFGPQVMAASAGVGYASIFGLSAAQTYDRMYNMAVLKGWSLQDASAVAFLTALGTGTSEFGAFKIGRKYLTADRSFRNALFYDILPEAAQEATQEVWETTVSEITGLTDKTFTEIAADVVMSAVAGAMGGLGVAYTNYKAGQLDAIGDALFDRRRKLNAELARVRKEIQQADDQLARQRQQQQSSQPTQPVETNEGAINEAEPSVKAQETQQTVEAPVTNANEEIVASAEDNAQAEQKLQEERTNLINSLKMAVDEKQRQQEVQEQNERLSKETEEYISYYKNMYFNKAKQVNKDISEAQLNAGWRMIEGVIRREAQTGYISNMIDNLTENMLATLDALNRNTKANIKQFAERFNLTENGEAVKGVKDMFSADGYKRFTARLNYFKNSIIELFAANGMKAQGKIYARMAGNFMENEALIWGTQDPNNPDNFAPAFENLMPTILSVARARINGQKLDGFESILDNIRNVASEQEDPIYGRNLANNIALKMTDNQALSEEEENNINISLFGKSGIASAEDIRSALGPRIEQEEALFEEMGYSYGQQTELNHSDFITIALMREMGYDQNQINSAFGIQSKIDGNEAFRRALKIVAPKLTKAELNRLRTIRNAMQRTGTENVAGAYLSSSNTIVVGENVSQGEGIHEGVHALISSANKQRGADLRIAEDARQEANKEDMAQNVTKYGLMDAILRHALPQDELGIIDMGGAQKRFLDRIRAILDESKAGYTERQFQETVADAVMDFIRHGYTSDEETTKLLNECRASLNNTYQNIQNSFYKDLSKSQQNAIQEVVKDLLEPTYGRTVMDDIAQVENVVNNQDLAASTQAAIAFLDKHVMPDGDVYRNIFETYNENTDPNEQVDIFGALQGFIAEARFFAGERLLAPDYESEGNLDNLNYMSKSDSLEADSDSVFFAAYEKSHKPSSPDGKKVERRGARSGDPVKEATRKAWKEIFNTKNIKKEFKNFAFSVSDTLRQAHPALQSMVSRQMYELNNMTAEAVGEVAAIDRLIQQVNEREGADSERFIDEAKWEDFKRRYGNTLEGRKQTKEWIDETFKGMPEHDEAVLVWESICNRLDIIANLFSHFGIKIEMMRPNTYLPQLVQDREGLAHALKHADPESEVGKAIRRGRERGLRPSEIIDHINAIMQKNVENQMPAFFHRSQLERSPELLQFYADPLDALASYFHKAYQTILQRSLIGKQAILGGENKLHIKLIKNANAKQDFWQVGRVGIFFYEAQTTNKWGNISQEAMDNSVAAIKSMFERTGSDTNTLGGILRQINGIGTLANVPSAFNQTLELGLTAYKYGTPEMASALKDVLTKDEHIITLKELNLNPLNEMYRNESQTSLSKAQDWAYKHSGFKFVDEAMKNTTLNAGWNYYSKLFSGQKDTNGTRAKSALRFFDKVFPDQLYSKAAKDQIKNDIANKRLTDDVKYFLTEMLFQTQPLNTMNVSPFFNSAGPWGRLAGQFMTTPLKQIEYLIDDIYRQARESGDYRDAAKRLISFIFFAMMIGVPKDVMANALRGRKTNIYDSAMFSPLQFIMINEYFLAVAKKEGLASAVGDQLAIGIGVVDNVSKDIVRFVSGKDYKGYTWKNIPIIGPFGYWWLFGGRTFAEQNDEALMSDTIDWDAIQEPVVNAYDFVRGRSFYD